MTDKPNPQLTRQARAEVARATGHRYPELDKAVAEMTTGVQQDLIRLIRNLQSEARTEKQKRRRGQFWG